jgi:translation initiation factor IF-3
MKVNVIVDGKFMSDVEWSTALQMAKTQKKDLILINAKTNTYKIDDAGKLKYEQKQKEKQARMQKRAHKVKEIKIRPEIGEHDFEVKLNHAREFLTKGIKTKLIMMIRGRQITHKDLAIARFNDFHSRLVKEGIAVVEGNLKLDGRELIAFLVPATK